MIRLSGVLALAVFLAFPTAQVSARVVGLPSWDVVRSPDPAAESQFLGVSRVAAGEVWAVGSRGHRSLTARWNGSAFAAVPSPNVDGRARVLEDVDGIARTDVWAVGHSDRIDTVGSRTLIIRWNGSAWSRVASPNLGGIGDENVLSGVAAISRDDAWAVGWYRNNDPASVIALTLHWNGVEWKRVANACGPFLRDVVAISPTNVWAVGGNSTCRWNGSTWTRHPAAPGPNPNIAIDLQDVSAAGPGNVWAVGLGATSCGEGICHTGVVERWNGSTWSFTSVGEVLYGVDVIAADEIYAVGLGLGPAVLRYNGSTWERLPIPTPTPVGRLLAVDVVSSARIWAAGWQIEDGRKRTLAERAPSRDSGAVVGSTSVGNASVSWFGPETGSTASNQLGRYQVGGLRAGVYTFVASSPGCAPTAKTISVPAGTTISVPLPITC